jgi:polysaccharide export outer membrane protein
MIWNRWTRLSCCLAGLLVCCASLSADQQRAAPPKELVQYILEATRLGLQDAQIEQNARSAGWPASVVTSAIAYVRAGNVPPAGATPSVSPSSATTTPPAAAASSPKPAEPKPADTALAPSDPAASQSVPDDYRIGAGDVLQISVWKEPEASVPNAVVRPDGKIGIPLLKEVEVVGLTPREVERLVTARLSKFIPAADVTVVVSGIHSKKIYIVGAVKKEGPIPYTYRMTVLQALSEAGGLNDYAKRKKIYVLRTENGKEYRLPFDYEAVLRGERMELNIPLMPGDTLVVPH